MTIIGRKPISEFCGAGAAAVSARVSKLSMAGHDLQCASRCQRSGCVLFDFSARTAQTLPVEKPTESAIHPRPTGRPEAWHRLGAGGFLRDVVLGSSDGLVAVLAFVAGVSATLGARRTILLAGIAEMFAGAASMGLGAFLGSKSQREFYKSELLRERHEIAEMPREEREEIRQIYGKKGFQGKDLDMVVDRITED